MRQIAVALLPLAAFVLLAPAPISNEARSQGRVEGAPPPQEDWQERQERAELVGALEPYAWLAVVPLLGLAVWVARRKKL